MKGGGREGECNVRVENIMCPMQNMVTTITIGGIGVLVLKTHSEGVKVPSNDESAPPLLHPVV